MRRESLSIVQGAYSIHRLGPASEIPKSVLSSSFYSIGKTDEELSIVCESSINVDSRKCDNGWSCLKINGILFLHEVGILSGIASVLAAAKISIYAFSTYDTSYVMVRSERLDAAVVALKAANYQVT